MNLFDQAKDRALMARGNLWLEAAQECRANGDMDGYDINIAKYIVGELTRLRWKFALCGKMDELPIINEVGSVQCIVEVGGAI